MRQLLLLDLDGTVVDSMGLIIRCFREAVLPSTTRSPSDQEIAATFGPAEEECIERLLLHYHEQGLLREPYIPAMKQDAAARFHKLYADGYEHGLVECYPGMCELVQRVRAAGWGTAIFTGKGRGSAIATLEHVNLLSNFDAVVTSDDVKYHKPAPDGVLRACELTGVAPAQMIYAGDNPTDIIAGKRAGTRTAAAMWGAIYPEETLATQPDYVLHSVGELESLLFR